GNGLLLPTSIAGAVSIRPQVAGTASGTTGFIQMAIGAAAAQLGGHVIAHASVAMPTLLLMLMFGIGTAIAVWTLVRRAWYAWWRRQRGCDADRTACWMTCGFIGVRLNSTAKGRSASETAFAITAGGAMGPPSPTPLTPSGLSGDGECWWMR